MDHIDQHLATNARNPRFSASVQASLAIGKRALNRYYNMTDHSEVYRIAMGKSPFILSLIYSVLNSSVLHPRHKLEYFKSAGWEDEWIITAKAIVRTEYERCYEADETEDVSTDEVCLLLHHYIAFDSLSIQRLSFHVQLIFSTVYQPSQHPSAQSFETNSIDTSAPTPNMSTMFYFGGPNTNTSIHGFLAWHWITYLYLVGDSLSLI